MHSALDLDRYLDELEMRARQQGFVTALEIEPGITLIRRYSDDSSEVTAFSQRMLRVQAELQGTETEPVRGPAEAEARLAQLGAELSRESTGGDRQTKLREYLDLIRELPPEEQSRALRALDESGASDAQPDRAAADVLWSAIQTEADEEAQQDLIRFYLEMLNQFEEPEHSKRLLELNQWLRESSGDATDEPSNEERNVPGE